MAGQDGQSQYHSEVLSAINDYIAKNRIPPQGWLEAARTVALQKGYLINVHGTLAAGIGAAAETPVISGSAAITVPIDYNISSSLLNMNRSGLKASGELGGESFEVALTGYGQLTFEGKARVDGVRMEMLEASVGGGVPLKAYENSDGIEFVVDADFGRELGKGVVPVVRDVASGKIQFAFASLAVEIVKADEFYKSNVQRQLEDAYSTFRNQDIIPSDVTLDQWEARVKSNMGRADFVSNWQNLALIDLYELSGAPRRLEEISFAGDLPLGLGGNPLAAPGQSFGISKTSDGNYIIYRQGDYLWTSAASNEAYSVRRYQRYSSMTKEPIGAPATLRWEAREQAGTGGPVVDESRGIQAIDPDGVVSSGQPLNKRLPIFEGMSLEKWLQQFDRAFLDNCFPAGTPILMADGSEKAIEDIVEGDMVASFAPGEGDGRGEVEGRPVVRLFRNRCSDLVMVSGLRVTRGHPFLCDDGQFRTAGDLNGSRLVRADNSLTEPVSFVPLEEEADVYNFEVEGFHTYIAGGLRVHNISMNLEGGDSGWITFRPDGSAVGLIVNLDGDFRVIDFNRPGNTARVYTYSADHVSEAVWADLDSLQASPGSDDPALQAFGAAIGKKVPQLEAAREVILKYYDKDQAKLKDINLAGSVGAVLGGALGSYIFSGSALERMVGSTVFSVVGENIAELIRNGGKINLGLDLDTNATIFSDLPEEVLTAGIGAISSYLVGELVHSIGIDGLPGEILNSSAGNIIGKIATNLALGRNALDGLSQIQFANIAGAFIGTKLAEELISFNTVGGQIGSAVGSSLGVIAATEFLKIGGALGGVIGAAIGAFAGFIIGGLIGSIFGGTPRSGADVQWNAETGEFYATNVYSKSGGSKDTARSLASLAAETLNGIITMSGGRLEHPDAVGAGNYGMRSKNLVYRPISTRDTSAITFKVSSSKRDASQKLVNYGVLGALRDSDFRLVGGDVYVKRALYNQLDTLNVAPQDVDLNGFIGNMMNAQLYEELLDAPQVVGEIISDTPDSALSAKVSVILALASETGINRRARSDWFGGFGALLEEVKIAASNVYFVALPRAEGETFNRRIYLGSARLDDSIVAEHQAVVLATGAADVIDLRSGATPSGKTISIATVVDSGDGNDTIYASNLGDNIFGGAGNDTLYGGRLDDWLLGGDGDDILDAGTQDANVLGGDGNYLNGGAGNDILKGREGSDWLEGGDGVDTLTGNAGDDILVGGAGEGDSLKGGTGSDQYLVRRGDGADIAEEDTADAPVSTGAGDAITQRMAAIAAGTVKRDWVGTSAGVQGGAVAGGEDAIVFGTGIGIGDIKLQRSGTSAAPGNDLLVIVMTTVNGVESDSGTRLAVKDWFINPFKRIEWMKFADGNDIRIGDIISFVAGGSGDDVLVGTMGNDFVYGGAGNDKLFLLGGSDVGNGGTGNDMVAGDTGRDLLIGGLGNDELIGGAGWDAISGDDGADDIYGGADRDVLSGGRGDGDLVVGGSGDDTFKYARGDGRDTYVDEFANYWDVVWTAAGGWNAAAGYSYNMQTSEVTGPGGVLIRKNFGTAAEPDLRWLGRYDYDSASQALKFFNPPANAATITANAGIDTIEFAPGINIQDVILRHPAGTNDLVLAISSENEELSDTSLARDSITLKDWYLAPGQIEKLAFYQTGVMEIAADKATLIAGTDGADGTMATPLSGTAIADWITGGAGDDVIAGGAGNDILAGNSGFDTLRGEAGDDVLYGGAGNDILDGGTGKDILIGGAGEDAASYASSASAVRVALSAAWSNAGEAMGDEYNSIENIIGGSGADTLLGDANQNEITGGAGNDTLRGGDGDDTYIWNVGDGADTIYDAAFIVEEAVTTAGALSAGYSVKSWGDTGTIDVATGNHYWRLQVQDASGTVIYDSSLYSYAPGAMPVAPAPAAYIQSGWLLGFARSSGQQVTRSKYDGSVNAGADELEFGPNISLNDLTFAKSGNNLIISHGGSAASQVTLKDQLLANSAIESLKLNDGLGISLASVLIAANGAQLTGTAGDDLMIGQMGALADNLSGGDGDDVLVGYAGDDLLYGGNGDDIFEGGLGADLLDGGANSLSSEGTDAGDTARYVRSAAAVSVDLTLSAAQGGAAGSDSVGDILTGIENVVGSAFGDTLTGDANDNRLFGLDGADTLRGGGGNDIVVGDGGTDILYGDAGEDGLAGGEGDDALYGGSEKDQLDGGEGNDNLYGEAGDDTLTGQAGADLLDGGDGNDKLVGGSEGDQLIGGVGDDTLAGGTGNDNLQGGIGNDSYAFDAWSGSDTLIDIDGSNIVTFDSSVAYDRLWLTRVGNDLRVAVIGGDTQITVSGFFLGTGQSRIHAIQTTTHALFLDHPDTLNLVTAMTAATTTPSVTPIAMPGAVTPLLATYWHAGDKAAPTGPATPRALTLAEDAVINVDRTYGVIDHDQNVTGYSLKAGAGPALGTISNFNPATGALTYTPFADANGLDSFVVIATDADGQSVELPVTVTITPVNDAPRDIAVAGGGSLTVLESAPGSSTANGTVIGQFSALDVEGDAITYSLTNDAGGRFSITATGELRVLNASLLDRETASSHAIQVTATDAFGAAATTSFTVIIGNVNEAPNAPVLTTSRGIAPEYVAAVNSVNLDTMVAQFSTSDPDGAPAPALAFAAGGTGNPGNRFKIVGNEIRFAAEPDFETLSAQGFAITDSDGDGLGEIILTGAVIATDGSLSSAASTAFSVRIEDVNQQQVAIALNAQAVSISERDRVAAGTARPAMVLGMLSVTDPDLPGQLTGQHGYAVFEGSSTTASTRFGVDGSNQLVLLANQSLDFETDGASITLKVRATDKSANPLSLDQTFTFAINNVDDVLEGTASADTLTGQQNRDVLRGLAGDDILSGLAGNDQLEGGDGNDLLYGGDDGDTLLGQAGNDTLNGDAGNDNLSGGDGDDVLTGGLGDDVLNGDAGNDGMRAAGTDAWRGFTVAGLMGGDGNDILNGGDGDDYLDGGLGADQLNGGLGFDGVSYDASAAAVTVNLALGTGLGGSAQGDTLTGIELVQGSAFADTITGSAANDVLYGGAGNDTIRGGTGDDFLLGGAGDDYLDAEAGDDYLDGGLGNDILIGGSDNDVYFIGRNQGDDRIRNFDSTGTNFDQIGFDGTILYTDIWFDRVDDTGAVNVGGAHLRMTVLGANGPEGTATVENWFTSPDHGLPDSYFKIDLISDGAVRAALPVNVDALVTLMAGIPAADRPVTQAQMAALRSGNQNFSNAMEDYWGRLNAPRISDTVAISGIEPLDNGAQTVSFAVRAWFQDDQGLGITIPASQIDLTLTATGGNVLSNYVTAVNYGAPDASGNRTVTLTLAPNASTHLLPGGTLPLQLQAQIRGTTRVALDAGGIALTIAPTADTASFSQLASAGGNAGTYIPLSIAAITPDVDGSERVDVLIKGLPSGYSLTNAAGTGVGTFDAANGWWRLTTAQLTGLKLFVPAGRYENAPLQVAAQAIDGPSTRTTGWSLLTVIVNGAPTNVTLAGSVAENAATGILVGTLTGIDPDTGEGVAAPTSFQLLNDAGGRYRLDPANSSRLLVNNGGANLDYEAANRDALNTITVRVTDANGLFKDVNLVVPVTNVNETPIAPGGGATVWSFFDETGLGSNPAIAGGGVASFALGDPDGSVPALQFAAGGNPNNWFTIVGNQVRFSAGTSYDFEWFRANGYGIYDWNGDGRLDAHIADVKVQASDGALTSGQTLLQVFISDVNERPNNLTLSSQTPYSETVSGDTAHSGRVIATFGLSDPDGPSPGLVITSNPNGWFQVINGNQIAFSPGVNFTADWLRGNKGQWGTDADYYYDIDGDGLKEIRVATLTLKAQDANGAQSDPFTYNVFIEDKNEAPVWATNPFTFFPNENPGWYQYVGTVWGTDVDGPTSELRYVFSNWNRYYDGNLGIYVSLTPDSRFVMTDAGAVYVNGNQTMDFDTGPRNFSYQTLIYDKAFGANNAYNYGTLNINLQDVNEPHNLVNASFDVWESDTAQGPYVPLATTAGTPISLRNSILSDPEGRNMRWQFANGTADNGAWHIDSDGTLHMYQGVDYDRVAAVYTDHWIYLPTGGGGFNLPYVSGFDPAKARFSLDVQAIDDSTGVVRTSTITLAVQNIDEAPYVYPSTLGNQTANVGGVFQIYSGQSGAVVNARGWDPEATGMVTPALYYSISGLSFTQLSGTTPVNSRPAVTIDGFGQVTLGSAWKPSSSYVGSFEYRFTVYAADSGGHTTSTPMVLRFMPMGAVKPPLIFDMDGDGIEMISRGTSQTSFDFDGDGIADKAGWVGPDDGFLALDRNGNGAIDNIGEISFAADLEGAVSDLEGLRAYDTNANGFFDEEDAAFGDFRIWQDVNSDGISQEGELKTLAERGIKSVNLTLTLDESPHDETDNFLYGTTEYFRTDGSRAAVGDVFLAYEMTAPVSPPPEEPAHDTSGQSPSSGQEGLAAPIVFDYDGDSAALVALNDSAARFDMNKDGIADKTGWIEQGDALLALDRNGNGTIDNIDEISFIGDKAGARTDLEGLAGFDSNGDGVLDGGDERFVEFRLWFDGNGNGKTDAGELLSLAQAGVSSISLTGTATGQIVTQGNNIVYNSGSYTLVNGQSGRLMDAGFAFKALSALPEITFQSSVWEGKSRDYRLTSATGTLHVTPRDSDNPVNAGAGLIAPAALLDIANGSVGMLSTIIVDLDGDGLEARRMKKAKAEFDMDGDHIADDTGWVSGGDGLLVIDRDGDGKITGPSEISFLSEKADAKSAWDALAVLDNNKDGKISKTDVRFADLKIWKDSNANGVTDAGELQTLGDLGIKEIALASTPADGSVKLGYNAPLTTALFTRENGVTGTIGNVALAFDPSSKRGLPAVPDVTTPPALVTQVAASQLLQAISSFDAGAWGGSLESIAANQQNTLDLLAASAA